MTANKPTPTTTIYPIGRYTFVKLMREEETAVSEEWTIYVDDRKILDAQFDCVEDAMRFVASGVDDHPLGPKTLYQHVMPVVRA